MSHIVTIATFHTPWQASLAKNALEAEGINAVLANENSVAADTGVSNSVVANELLVAQSDLERSRAILDELQDNRADVNWDEVDVGEPE